MQRALVVHNRNAGTALTTDELTAGVRGIAFEPKVISRKALSTASLDGVGAVFVAGGDGTVAKAMRRTAGSGVPLGIIPCGTANNIARSIGLSTDPHEAIRSFARAEVVGCDLGLVSGLCDEPRFFVEGLGAGLFAFVLAEHASSADKVEQRALRLLSRILTKYTPPTFRISADGKDHSGRYLIVAAMNMRAVGPNLFLAPEASPTDGQLDLALVPAESRDALFEYFRKRIGGDKTAELPAVRIPAREIKIQADGPRAHIDDQAATFRGGVTVNVHPGIVRLLRPPTRKKPRASLRPRATRHTPPG